MQYYALSAHAEINVLYFAYIREAAGISEEKVKLVPGTSVKALLKIISAIHPNVKDMLDTVQVSVNFTVVGKNRPLKAGDEVALLPPITGG